MTPGQFFLAAITTTGGIIATVAFLMSGAKPKVSSDHIPPQQNLGYQAAEPAAPHSPTPDSELLEEIEVTKDAMAAQSLPTGSDFFTYSSMRDTYIYDVRRPNLVWNRNDCDQTEHIDRFNGWLASIMPYLHKLVPEELPLADWSLFFWRPAHEVEKGTLPYRELIAEWTGSFAPLTYTIRLVEYSTPQGQNYREISVPGYPVPIPLERDELMEHVIGVMKSPQLAGYIVGRRTMIINQLDDAPRDFPGDATLELSDGYILSASLGPITCLPEGSAIACYCSVSGLE